MAAIKRDRRWEELKPRFTVFLEKSSGDFAKLHVALVPGRLDYLDEVRFAILDEVGHDHWTYGLPDGVTEGEADAFVWGPYEFNTDASEQVASNRWSEPRRFSHIKGNNREVVPLRRTRPRPVDGVHNAREMVRGARRKAHPPADPLPSRGL
jgi:hypothetical protein